ncbi:MAG: hypothetical protein ABSF26_17520 [Thermoguttaceae bacterium]|jgi:hypothetical protein
MLKRLLEIVLPLVLVPAENKTCGTFETGLAANGNAAIHENIVDLGMKQSLTQRGIQVEIQVG